MRCCCKGVQIFTTDFSWLSTGGSISAEGAISPRPRPRIYTVGILRTTDSSSIDADIALCRRRLDLLMQWETKISGCSLLTNGMHGPALGRLLSSTCSHSSVSTSIKKCRCRVALAAATFLLSQSIQGPKPICDFNRAPTFKFISHFQFSSSS